MGLYQGTLKSTVFWNYKHLVYCCNLNCCVFIHIKLLFSHKLNLWIMKKEWVFVIGISIVHDRLIDPKQTFFTDEADFNL
jgi:hypothetical protein